YHAYVFMPDKKAERRLEGIAMPGDPPPSDAKPDPTPPSKEPVKILITLLVDDADPRADALWQRTLRKRFDEAAAVIEAHAGLKLEFAGYATWESDRDLKVINELLTDFTTKFPVKA